jgi:hypothetical protein
MSRRKVLSIREPEASHVFIENPNQRKVIENRTWNTDYRGRLYIHASGSPPANSPSDVYRDPPWPEWQCGRVIGHVDLIAVVRKRDKPKDGNRLGRFRPLDEVEREVRRNFFAHDIPFTKQIWADLDYQGSEFFWIFVNPTRLAEPIPSAGRTRIWEF